MRIPLVILGLVVWFSLAGAEQFPLVVTDDLGRTVTISAPPQRLVSLAPSHTEILFALGALDRLAGVSEADDYPPLVRELPRFGTFPGVNLEAVVGLEPDLVLAAGINNSNDVQALEALGVTVLWLDPKDIGDVLRVIGDIAQVLNLPRQGAALVEVLEQRMMAVSAVTNTIPEAERPRIYFELDSTLFAAGPSSFTGGIIAAAGGANIVRGDLAFPQLSAEAIVAADPEVVVLADAPFGETAASFAARAGFSMISAVQSGQIIELTADQTSWFSRPGPRVVDALEFLARALYPEQF
ncbi:MAG: ABC transporter substrate-binding protein [Deinococcus sp.]|nr:ABC transporter substrate-binding protein [Deinococcus sp.]